MDFFSSDTNLISMTPGVFQRHNGSGGQVVKPYWPTGYYVLANSVKIVLLKNLTRAATLGQGAGGHMADTLILQVVL